jgi:hypothetical protein
MVSDIIIRYGAFLMIMFICLLFVMLGYMASWDFYLDMVAPFAGRVAYLTTVGNHESDQTGKQYLFET